VITLKDKQKIILESILEGKPQRQVAREMKISRTTIGKYIKSYEDVKSKLMGSDDLKLKEDIICPPKYNSAGRKKQKLTDEILQKIQLYLKENEEKRITGRSKQQKKKIDILEALKDNGHDIGYTTVCNAVREIERRTREAFIRQQYSWGHLQPARVITAMLTSTLARKWKTFFTCTQNFLIIWKEYTERLFMTI